GRSVSRHLASCLQPVTRVTFDAGGGPAQEFGMRVLERAHYLALAVLTTAAGCGGDDSSGNTNGGGTSAAGNGGSASGGRSAGGSAAGGTAGMAGAAGDAGCESPPSDNDVEVAGAYRDDYGFSHRVDDQLWRSGDSLFHVLDHSN